MLEIGLGCDMKYGPGASAHLWRSLLPHAEIWEADRDETCVDKHRLTLSALGIKALVGDQGQSSTLEEWLRVSGARHSPRRNGFDFIIDDGSHRSFDMLASFEALWPTIKPGGFYFLEDMSVSRSRASGRDSPRSCIGRLHRRSKASRGVTAM